MAGCRREMRDREGEVRRIPFFTHLQVDIFDLRTSTTPSPQIGSSRFSPQRHIEARYLIMVSHVDTNVAGGKTRPLQCGNPHLPINSYDNTSTHLSTHLYQREKRAWRLEKTLVLANHTHYVNTV